MRVFFVPIIAFVCCLCFLQPGSAAGEKSGAEVFESLKCGVCHKPDVEVPAGFSLAQIAKAYQTKDKLVEFMTSGFNPIMESEKKGMMKGQMSKLTALGKEEREALADYIMKFK